MSVLKQKNATQWIPVNETIKIYVRKKSDLQEQDTIEIHNLIAKKPTNTHYLNYLIKEGITATIFPSSLTYTLLKRPNYSIQKAIRTLRTNTFNRCQSKCSEKCFLLFSSLFLGNNFFNKESIKKQQQTFQWWGISHHLARSGLHLVIFVFLISLLANCFYAPFFLKQFFIIMIILFYSFLSWPSISFLRALFTTGLYCTCNLLELPIDFLHLLTIVTLIVLITSPHQLFSLDFQLSFGLTYALAWLSNVQKSTKKRIP